MDFDNVFGLDLGAKKKEVEVPEEVAVLVTKRQAARVAKDWAKGDELRDKVRALGYKIQDKPDGSFEIVRVN
jgi:cysteinyl-tRNA synthetase